MFLFGKLLFTVFVNSEKRLSYSKLKTISSLHLSLSIQRRNLSDTTLRQIIGKQIHTMNETKNSNVFKGAIDRFNGVTVTSEGDESSDADFAQKLQDSLEYWKSEDRRGIWFRVHLNQASWVPILAKAGFRYHNTSEDFVTMYLWLPKSPSNIPHYAHTMIGVGAVVVNDQSQVLVVSEKHYKHPHWKLPGGYVEPGENLVDAAIREVYEETNISTEFLSLLTFRHTHNRMFGCSDIYMVVSLKPTSNNIEKCDREIADSKWMDIDEYLTHPHVHELNRFVLEKYLEYNRNNVKVDCHHDIHQVLKVPYVVYYVTEGNKDKKDGTTEESS